MSENHLAGRRGGGGAALRLAEVGSWRSDLQGCHESVSRRDNWQGAVQNARTIFEAAAREVGILDEAWYFGNDGSARMHGA